jgi:signal transduction histidine kinase
MSEFISIKGFFCARGDSTDFPKSPIGLLAEQRMKSLVKESLGFRLLSASIFVIVVVLSAQTIFYMSRARDRVRSELTNKGRLLSDLLAYSSRVGVFAENGDQLRDVAAGVLSEPDVMQVGIYNANGKQLYLGSNTAMSRGDNPEAGVDDPSAGPEGTGAMTRETGKALVFTKPVVLRIYPRGERSLYFGDAGEDIKDRTIGYVKVVLGKESLNRTTLRIVTQNVIVALMLIGASVVVVFLRVRKITRPLVTLTEHVKALGKGGEAGQVPVETMDEIGKLASAFNTMLVERRDAEQSLQKVLMDIHDGIGGITTNIYLLSEIAQKAAGPAEVKKAVATISSLSREGIGEIRSLMYSLDREDMTWHSVSAEIRNQGMKMVEPHAISFEMTSEIAEAVSKPGSLLCLSLFRIYRESLMNVIKHSRAKRVNVGLRVSRQQLLLAIRDDGVGLDETSISGKGRGIISMKARAAEIGGTVTITSDQGACVTVELPLTT